MMRYQIELTAIDTNDAVEAIQVGDVTDVTRLPGLLDALTTNLLDGLEPGPMPSHLADRIATALRQLDEGIDRMRHQVVLTGSPGTPGHGAAITRALWDDDETPELDGLEG